MDRWRSYGKPTVGEADPMKRLNEAVSQCRIKTIRQMLEFGEVDANERDMTKEFTTVLMKICHLRFRFQNSHPMLRVLNSVDINPDIRDDQGRTALMHACLCGQATLVDFLLSKNAGMHIADSKGNSAIVYAIKAKNYNILESLLEEDASVRLIKRKNIMGLLPVDIARQTGDPEIMKLVERYHNSVLSQIVMKKIRSRRWKHILPQAVLQEQADSNADTRLTSKLEVERPYSEPGLNWKTTSSSLDGHERKVPASTLIRANVNPDRVWNDESLKITDTACGAGHSPSTERLLPRRPRYQTTQAQNNTDFGPRVGDTAVRGYGILDTTHSTTLRVPQIRVNPEEDKKVKPLHTVRNVWTTGTEGRPKSPKTDSIHLPEIPINKRPRTSFHARGAGRPRNSENKDDALLRNLIS